MKFSLLFRDRSMDWKRNNSNKTCFDDFKYEVLLNTMSKGNQLIYDCSEKVMMYSLLSKDEIYYRQEVIKDCINNQKVILDVFQITESAINEITLNSRYVLLNDFPSVVMNNSLEKLCDYIKKYTAIREKLLERKSMFHSEGFQTLIQEIENQITPEFIKKVEEMTKNLAKTDSISIEASLGVGYRATKYTLCGKKKGIAPMINSYQKVPINNSDILSIGYLLDLKQRGLEDTADILACVVDEMSEFFTELQKELAFYCGCIQLYQSLREIGCKVIFPEVYPASEHRFNFHELYDVGLALSQQKQVVGNSLDLDPYNLIIITGANQGGKSTFLRSVGLAQIMFQCGMFVGAQSYESSLCTGIYTHFRKDEDVDMNSGKLDDELRRFREIVEVIQPNSILMCNESFSSTNEKEGTEIAIPIIDAMTENEIKVFIVTHFYSIPKHYERIGNNDMIVLQAERKEDASRSFKMVESQLNENSYGIDIYNQLFKKI